MICLKISPRLIAFVSHPVIRYIIALTFTVVATVMLVQSSARPLLGPPAPPEPPDLKREILLTSGHIVVFCGIVLLWWWALCPNLPSSRALFVAVGFGLIFGLMTELAQSFVPDRQVSVYDLAVNWAATLITAASINRRQAVPISVSQFARKLR